MQTLKRVASQSREDGAPLSHEEESLRLIKEQADKLELANAKTRGEQGSIPEFEQSFRGALVTIRQAVLAVGSRLPPVFAIEEDAAKIKIQLIEELKRALLAGVDRYQRRDKEMVSLLEQDDEEAMEEQASQP